MDRRKFIATGCISCISGGLITVLLGGCGTTKMISAAISGDDMIVPLSHFETKKGSTATARKYVIAQNEILQYPICVYRLDENNYQALWMKCTHQGAELQVFGDKLQCPAHGSEFDHNGKVENGPANKPLRTFPVTVTGNQLKISLK